MSGVVFILHSAADEKYAAELAGALAPLPAFPITLDAGAPHFGLGSVCVVAWTSNSVSAGMAETVTAALPDSLTNAVICVVDGAPLPDAIGARAGAVAHARGPVASYAAQLRDVIANRQRELAERNPRGLHAPQLGATSGASMRAPNKQPLAMRSAYGLAATLAAVGFVAPALGLRPAPSDAAPSGAPSAPTAPANVAENAAVEQDTTQAAPSSASALDLWLTTGSVTAPEPAPAPAEPRAEVTLAAAEAAGMAPIEFAVLSIDPLPMPVLTIGKSEAAGPTIVVADPGAVTLDKRAAEVAESKPATMAGVHGADAAHSAE